MFEFQVVVTNKCNLKCKYCYINQTACDMNSDIFKQHYSHNLPMMMNYYENRDKKFNMVLFGGEPTIKMDLITYITYLINKDKNCQNKILITNGLLLKPHILEILRKNLNLSVSLSYDGLWTDVNRLNHIGEKVSDKYLTDDIYKSFQSSKIMISPDSLKYKSLLENYMFLQNKFNWNSPDFSLVRDDIWTDDDINLFEKQSKELINYLIKENNQGHIGLPGIYTLILMDIWAYVKYERKRPYGCYAGICGAGFMPDGSVYPCARFGTNDKYQLIDSKGNPNIENIEKIKFLTKTCDMDKCKQCEFYNVCNAGCTYSQIENSERLNQNIGPIDSICRLYKILYNHVDYLLDNVTHEKFIYYIRKMIST